MNLKNFCVVILLIFLTLSIFSDPSLSSYQSLTKSTTSDFVISLSGGQTYYSTYVDNNSKTITIYTAQSYNGLLYLQDYSLVNNQFEGSGISIFNLTQLLGKYGSLQYDNYFVSNGSTFVTLDSNLNDVNTFTIISLNTNTSISFRSNQTTYNLSLISRLPNSSDVYFSLYNTTTFFIVKYNFATNNFSLFFHSNYPNIGIISPVTVFQYTENIYASVPTNNSSHLLVFNQKGLILNESLPFQINTFTPYKNNYSNTSFLLYANDGTLYSYTRVNNTNQLESLSTNLTNLMVLRPFDNTTIMAVGPTFLDILQINATLSGQLTLQQAYSYAINYQGDLYLQNLFQALKVNGTKYYLYENQFTGGESKIVINHYYNPPTDYDAITTTSSYIFTTPINPAGPVTTSSSSQVNTPIISLTALILVVIGLGGIAFIFYRSKSRTDRNYPREYYRPYRYTRPSQNTQSNRRLHNNSFCPKCGSPTLSEDVFCQNCGTRL